MACPALPEMPNGPILELHGQRKRFSIPFRLKGLLEDLTREVLRSQPKNIYQFLADLADQRVLERDVEEMKDQKDKRPSWEWKRWSWQGSSKLNDQEMTEFLNEYHVDRDIADALATTIQTAYRGFRDRRKYSTLKREFHLRLKNQGDSFADLTIAHHRELERLLHLHKIDMGYYPHIGFAIADHPEAMEDLIKTDPELHSIIKNILEDFLNNMENSDQENAGEGEEGGPLDKNRQFPRKGSRKGSSGKDKITESEMEGEEELDMEDYAVSEKDESMQTKPIARASLLKNMEAIKDRLKKLGIDDDEGAEEEEEYETIDMRPETQEDEE